ncbi:MAG: EFR1 family ferrodoxin [Thermodesulfobacteriota bacterium]
MKIHIVCFSQTGNTRKVAKAIAGVCQEAGHAVKTIAFKKATHADVAAADLVGVGAPCFESQAPTPVREFLRGLPSLEGKKAFVFSTSGGAPGRVLWDLAGPLKTKGARVAGGFLCRGTCYYPIPCLVGRFPGRPDRSDLEQARRFATALLNHLASDSSGPMKDSRPEAFRHGLGLYHFMGAILKEPLMRFLMPMPKAGDRCNSCAWCVNECPTKSIRLNPKPEIAATCIRCYRCLNGCPEQAFSVQWGISNFLTWTLYNTTFERWFGDVQADERLY